MATFIGTDGTDTFVGGDEDDLFDFSTEYTFSNTDSVSGGGGFNIFRLGETAYSSLRNVTGIHRLELVGRNWSISENIRAEMIGASADGKHVLEIIGTTGPDYFIARLPVGYVIDFTSNGGAVDIVTGSGDDILRLRADEFTLDPLINAGGGNNTLIVTTAGTISAKSLEGIYGINRILLADGANNITLTAASNSTSLTIFGGSGNDHIDGSASRSAVSFIAGSGMDILRGGNGADSFYIKAEDLDGDTIDGGWNSSGKDTLYITTAGTLTTSDMANVSNIEKIVLAESSVGNENQLTLGGGQPGTSLEILGGTGFRTIIDASAYQGIVDITAQATNNALIGTHGNDTFRIAYDQLDGDSIQGGDGFDRLILTSYSDPLAHVSFMNVRGIEEIVLPNQVNNLTLDHSLGYDLQNGVLSVVGGTKSDTISSSILSRGVALSIVGNGGGDWIVGGRGNDSITLLADAHNIVDGGDGVDTLTIQSTAAPMDGATLLSDVYAVETIIIHGSDTVTLHNSNFDRISMARIAVTAQNVDGSGLTADHWVDFTVAHDGTVQGGAGRDVFRVAYFGVGIDGFVTPTISGNGGADTLYVTASNATINANHLANVRGIETFILARGNNHITIDDAIFRDVAGRQITFAGNDGNDVIDASALSSYNSIQITSHIGLDTLIGGAGNDIFHFMAEKLDGDTVIGNGGYDTLSIGTAGTLTADALRNVSGVERIMLAVGQNSIALTDANVVGLANNRIEIWGQFGNVSVDASALSRAYGIDTRSGGGNDSLTGGAGTDIFRFNITDLNSSDSVSGGGWADQLILIGGGSLSANDLSGVRGVETIILWGGPAQITLADSLFRDISGGRITIQGSSNADRIDGSNLSAGHSILAVGGNDIDQIIGGAGNDRIQGGAGADLLTGGGGRDQFVWNNAGEGGDSILDFVVGQDQLVFNAAAFGVNGATLDVRSTNAAGDLSTTDLLVYDGILDDSAAVRSLLGGNDSTVDAGLFVVARDADNHSILYYTASADGSGANAGVHMIADLGAITPASLGVSDFLIG